jgi:hypothetical protein
VDPVVDDPRRTSEFTKLIVGFGIVIASVLLGFLIAAPVFDAGARSICSGYASEEDLVLIDAEGNPFRGGRLHPIPAYSCRFRDPTGATLVVDESDDLIDVTRYPQRGRGLAGFLVWAGVVLAGVALSRALRVASLRRADGRSADRAP